MWTPSWSRWRRMRGAAILTNDFNLNRVADLQSIRVLNINSLANALKPALLPGRHSPDQDHHRGQGAGPGGRLPGRRHDGRGRGRRPARRPRAGRAGDARPADRHGPDGVRAGSRRVSEGRRRSGRGGRGRRRVQPPDGRTGQARGRTGRTVRAALVGRGAGRGRGRPDSDRDVAGPSRARSPPSAGCPNSVVAVVAGGERRQESVAAGVAALSEPDPFDERDRAVAAGRALRLAPAPDPGFRIGPTR